MKRWKSAAVILAGRWQIPLAICAVVVAGIALNRMRPPARSVPFEALLADVLTLAERGAYRDAADSAANLLEMDPALPTAQRAQLHDTLAEIIQRQELIRGIPNRANARMLLRHHEQALAYGKRPDAAVALRAARAHEWLGEGEAAIDAYRSTLARQPTADTRRSVLQRLVRLLDGRPGAESERQGYVRALLEEEGVPPGYLWWALQHGVQEALEHDQVDQARELLTRYGQRFKRSDLKGYHDYLWAWVHTHEGQTELADPLLDRVERWLNTRAGVDSELDQAGFLPAMCHWLRGRVELAEARPQAALARFDQALALQSHGNLRVMITDGRAAALALLERHEAARDAIRATVVSMQADSTGLSAARPQLRQTALRLAGARRDKRDHENAIRYVELAAELTPASETAQRLDLLEQTGREYAAAAYATADTGKQREWHAAAARAFELASEMARSDEPRHATLLWQSAEEFDQGGQTADARRMLTRFTSSRSFDPRMPQALLRLGQAHAADGQLHEALTRYQELIATYPLLEESSRARLLSGSCLVALGPDRHAEARAIFESLLQDQHVTPQAQVFRDALVALCNLLHRERQYAAAISRLEDLLVFYPRDPDVYRTRFMLADAYRGSALGLLHDQDAGPEAARQRLARERLRRAVEVFEQFGDEVGQMPVAEPVRRVYERLALFYRGDCLFELNEPATLAEALAIYRQAAARYQGEPAALVAEVQIANIYLRQGKLSEAGRAVERARWLLGSVPEGVFAEYDDGLDRGAWDQYLSAVRSSNLFRSVFAGAP